MGISFQIRHVCLARETASTNSLRSTSNMITSPLRYPGGKSRLFNFFSETIKQNHLYGSIYCEPYAGGAGLALKLLASGFVDKISINDIDISIYAFWHSVMRNNEKFCDILYETPITIDEWHRQRDIWKTCNTKDLLSLGFAAYFLNRTNRSGIIEGAGPIGGYQQSSEWKIDARFIKKTQISNLRNLSNYSEQIEIYNMDALEYISETMKTNNNFMYLDPPYYVKGHKLYKNFYKPEDHSRIAEMMNSYRDRKWVISYDNVPQIKSLYSSFDPITYSLNYSAGRKTTGVEVIFLSDSLTPPTIDGFYQNTA